MMAFPKVTAFTDHSQPLLLIKCPARALSLSLQSPEQSPKACKRDSIQALNWSHSHHAHFIEVQSSPEMRSPSACSIGANDRDSGLDVTKLQKGSPRSVKRAQQGLLKNV